MLINTTWYYNTRIHAFKNSLEVGLHYIASYINSRDSQATHDRQKLLKELFLGVIHLLQQEGIDDSSKLRCIYLYHL